MNILQFFHGSKLNGDVSELPLFNIGDKVRLKRYPENVRLQYNKYYPNCALSKEQWIKAWDHLAEMLGYDEHTVTKVPPPALLLVADGLFMLMEKMEAIMVTYLN